MHEGSVVAWLTAADLLIHNGCTSAVEAALLGTPALSYRPVKQPGFDNDLPNGLSREFEDAVTLIAAVVDIVSQRRDGRHQLDPKRRALLDNHIAALSGPLACKRLVDEIERCHESPESPAGLTRRLVARARLAARRSSAHSKTLDQGEEQSGLPAPQISRIGVGKVNERIDRLRAVLGRFDGFAAEEIMPDQFRFVDRSSDRLAAR